MWCVNSWERVCHTLKDKDKDRDKDKDNETEKRKGGGSMKAYDTDRIGSTIAIGDFNTHIAMTIGGNVISVFVPNDSLKVSEFSDDYRNGESLSDWLERNGNANALKEL